MALGIVDTLIVALAVYMSVLISSIPLWLASKLMGLRRATLGRAVLATLAGGLIAVLILVVTASIAPLNVLLALVGYLWTLKTIYDIGWGSAFVLVIVSAVVSILTIIVLAVLAAIPLVIFRAWHVPVIVPPGPPWA